MNGSMFSKDTYNEQVLGEYLDLYFYPKFQIQEFERIHGVNNNQYAGIDVRITSNNHTYLIDEKGYLSKPTIQNSFVLELSSLNREKQRVEGWFYKPEKQTTHYLMCWADRENIDIYREQLMVNHLHRVEVMLVNRHVLQNYLDVQYHINRQYIYNNHDNLLAEATNGPFQLLESNLKCMVSYQYPEQPFNIIMPKIEYIRSGAVERRCMIYRDRIEYL